MDPKQTAPQGGQEGQSAGPAGNAGFNFSADGSKASGKLSTGANVSRTMDSLNSEQGATYGGMSFSKHSFGKIEPGTGDIILSTSDSSKPKRGLFGLGRKSSAKPSGWDMNAAQAAEAAKTGSAPTEQAFTTNRSSVAIVPSEYQNPAPEKKPLVSKKILIVLAVVVVLVAGGVGGYFLVTQNMGKKSSSDSGSQTSNLTLQESFNRFANWIFYGTDSTSSFTAGKAAVDAGIRGAMSSEDKNTLAAFLDTANNYSANLSTAFSKDERANSELLSNYIVEIKNDTGLLHELYAIGYRTTNSELNELAANDGQALEDYSSLSDYGEIGGQLAEAFKARNEEITKTFAIFQQSRCIENGEFNAECRANVVASNGELVTSLSKAGDQDLIISSSISSLINTIMNDIRSINSELTNPTSNNAEGE